MCVYSRSMLDPVVPSKPASVPTDEKPKSNIVDFYAQPQPVEESQQPEERSADMSTPNSSAARGSSSSGAAGPSVSDSSTSSLSTASAAKESDSSSTSDSRLSPYPPYLHV